MKKRFLTLALVGFTGVSLSGQFQQGDVPAYNAAPPKPGQKLPAIMSAAELPGTMGAHPAIAASYKAAAKVPNVIHQLPCYCHCDRSAGHNSLHSCFESAHGAHCSTCMKEAIFAEKETRAGKTPKQIRDEIIAGKQNEIDLESVSPSDIPDKPAHKASVKHASKKS